MNRRAATIAMCMLMVVSTAPLTNAEGQEESSIWGITYDWSHFEGDAFNMTGVDVNDLNADLSAAAEYAGFDMDYDEVLSGTTQVFVESWDEAGPFTVTTDDGSSHQVGKRITELTVRHGSMADTGMATNWSDGGEKIEAWLSAYQDYMLVMNANYVEYVDENMFVYGAEIALDSTFSVSMGFDAEIGVTAASETVSPDVSANIQLSFDIPNLEATWTPYEAVDYHFVMGSQPSSESGPGVDPDDDWHPYTYCSSEEFQTYQMCNEVEFEQGDRRFIQYHEPGGGELQGTFSSISSYSMEVSAAGLPTEEFDVDIDVFNVALSDSIPDQGLIYGEMAVDSYALWGHNCPPISNSETVTVDGTDYQAQCGLALPVPWAMAGMMGQSLSQALESGVQELADVAMGEVEDLLGEVDLVDSGGDDDYFEPDFVCDDGQTIPRYWFNDGYPDCSDGSDELASNDDHHDGEGPYYEWLYEQPTEFPNVTEGSSLHNVLSEGELIYCTDPFYPPFESYDSAETLIGFDVDVADYLASTLSDHYETPVEFTHVESEWDPIIPNLNEGSMCDAIISAMTKTPARESGVDFTRGYYTWSQGVVGGPGSDDISDVYELDANGVTIGVVSGLHSEFWASENLGMATVSAYEDIDSLLAALDSGDVMYALGETTLLSTDHAIMATFDEEHFGIALREGNNELLTALDVAINHLVESEYYASIHSEWLQGEPYVINDWSPDWDFGSHEQEYYGDEPGDESGDSSEDGFTCLYETWQVIPSSGVNDGYPDCYDGSDEETAPEVWACAVDVRVDSLPDTSFESFADKANEHPGFPEWCGEEVGELQIGDSQPNLPPPEDYYGAAIDEFDGFQGWQYVQARNATHWIQIGTGEMQDCSDEDLSWHEEYSGCAEPAAPDIAIDGELIQGQWGFTRYHWSGDYLYLAVPVNEALTPAWVAMGPRVTDFICDFDHNNRVPGWQVGDGVEDCYNGADENPDASSDEPGDPAGSTDLESMFEALDASNLQKTMEAFSERLDILLQDNVPDEPKYDIEDLCATMLWDPSDVRVLGVALVLEGGLLLGPQIENSMPHPTTTINVQFLSGQAARDAKSGASSQSSFDEMAPPSKHDLAKLYEILGPDYLPDLDTTDSDGDGTMDFFDSDDDNDGIPDWEDSEPKSLESEAGSSSLPAHGLVATLSVIAAAAMLIPRRED